MSPPGKLRANGRSPRRHANGLRRITRSRAEPRIHRDTDDAMFQIVRIRVLLFFFVYMVAASGQDQQKKTDAQTESALVDPLRKRPDDFQASHRLAEFYGVHGRMDAAIP